MPAYWRILETEIIRYIRGEGFDIEQREGHNYAIIACNDDARAHEIDLTEFAKELAQALGMLP